MNTTNEIYEYLNYKIPSSLSEEWDNDGIMCRPKNRKVSKILLALDITTEVIDYAVSEKCELIISHHPLIFHPLKSLTDPKLCTLINNNISAFSFHTRLDTQTGGVNDTLAELLGLINTKKSGMATIGEFQNKLSHEEFTDLLKDKLGCEKITCIEKSKYIQKVFVLGGDGKDFYNEAVNSGADTYICGNMSYNTMIDANEGPINVYEAGHFETEFPVLKTLKQWISEFDPEIQCEIYRFNPIKTL